MGVRLTGRVGSGSFRVGSGEESEGGMDDEHLAGPVPE